MSYKNKKKPKNSRIGKVGWCTGEVLGLSVGHYVFIRRVRGNLCDVNTLSSIKTKEGRYQIGKIRLIENGKLYPLPKSDISVKRFSGIDRRVIRNIPLSAIKQIGNYKIKRRHHHFIQKYLK